MVHKNSEMHVCQMNKFKYYDIERLDGKSLMRPSNRQQQVWRKQIGPEISRPSFHCLASQLFASKYF